MCGIRSRATAPWVGAQVRRVHRSWSHSTCDARTNLWKCLESFPRLLEGELSDHHVEWKCMFVRTLKGQNTSFSCFPGSLLPRLVRSAITISLVSK